jgi:hypothetical protein
VPDTSIPQTRYLVKHRTLDTYLSEGSYMTGVKRLASRWPSREAADEARQDICDDFADKWEVVEECGVCGSPTTVIGTAAFCTKAGCVDYGRGSR